MNWGYYLATWVQAGERPYEVLQEMGVYDEFLDFLSTQRSCNYDYLYRGLSRDRNITLNYTRPTSWTPDYEVALRFTDPYSPSAIIKLKCDPWIPSVDVQEYMYENPPNYDDDQYYINDDYYHEAEVIVAPISLRIVDTYYQDNIKVVEVEAI